jgi:predicted RNA binding protein YcfA (HicA-like mRNA interferase family)
VNRIRTCSSRDVSGHVLGRRGPEGAGEHGPFYLHDITGGHYILRWDAPEDHATDSRTVVVPNHDELRRGTLREIATQAGARDFQQFLDWLDRNL